VALNGVDLDIERGSFVSIVGPSGCGKSTLLQIVAGLIVPPSGAVFLDGARWKVRRPPHLRLFKQLHALAVPLEDGGTQRRVRLEKRGALPRAAIAARTRELIGLVKLAGFERHYPWQLSGGMQQRVAIARALACRPAVLLMTSRSARSMRSRA